jgi:hypothetical protein
MKKYLLLLMMAATVLASCSKDEDNQIPQVTAQELVGTWEFQNPTAAEVIVEGSNKELASKLKKDLTDEIATGKQFIEELITFKSDMSCTVTYDGGNESYKGSYTVTNGRLSITFGAVHYIGNNTSYTENITYNGSLEKKGSDLYLVYDKQMALESFASMIADPNSSAEEIAEYKATIASITTGISILRCPMKMVKK